ncbi:anti-sigma regulatory factor [Phytohabitans houttuyneae]|uniref:Transcriptional regulator n=1 Tax=Phytohabitans houttuyneae TaxID=1076126 RepID=A0A6V8KP10_9ACTN|nr:anti-sigma regulatory factor [Phytohabitans houttuyneae]GFJ83507.1 transcriptional regulator [Phytohabitans houttuyneae]
MTDSTIPDEGIWFTVDENATGSGARRAAERLAIQVGLAAARISELSIVVAELASNLVKHASGGSLLVRPVRRHGEAGVALFAVDSGPGMADLARSARDGHSTAGSLGIGLGAIGRLASWYDAHSVPGKGTVVVVEIWPGKPPELEWAAAIARPLTGGQVCGDGYAWRLSDERRQVLVSDGLGHGALAAAASQAAVHAFHRAPAATPAAVVEHLHRSISHTRGAALAVAELDLPAATVRFAGLGNIAATVLEGDTRRGMISLPGIAGHQRRAVREYSYPLTAQSRVVMHSDGVNDRWRPDDYPGLGEHHPAVAAATILRDAGVRRDDACVLVARG